LRDERVASIGHFERAAADAYQLAQLDFVNRHGA
jgi:hypothetical protein